MSPLCLLPRAASLAADLPGAALDGAQAALDLAGFIPGLGVVPDVANAAISAARGDYQEAATSLVAAIPLFGDLAKGGKLASGAIEQGARAARGLAENGSKLADEVAEAAAKQADEAAGASGKFGNEVVKPEKTLDGANEGIYEFPDQASGNRPYIGESGDLSNRLRQHKAAGRLRPGTEVTVPVPGGKTAREIAEHKRIQELTGGMRAKASDSVSNKRDPIGPKRRPDLGLPEPLD